MRIKQEAKTADTTNKPRFYDKERLSKLSQPRKNLKLKIKKRKRFNLSVDLHQRFPEIQSRGSKSVVNNRI